MVTVPSGSEPQVAFISGVTDAGRLAATSFTTWKGRNPATYDATFAREHKWGSTTIGTSGGTVTYAFDGPSQWTAVEQGAIEAGLALWSALANVSFTLATNAQDADQVFYRSAADDGSYQQPIDFTNSTVGSELAGQITKSRIFIETGQPYWHVGTPFDDAGGYGWQTVVHEIGHMLGLGHGGPYNGGGDVATLQFSAYDTRAWTLMSYIHPKTAQQDWGVATTDGRTGYIYTPTTPMVLDILAIQRLYGAATSGPLASGGQVFGFNTNIQGPAKRFFDFTDNKNPVVTLWDGGTNNTLDLSGFSRKSVVDLNPGKFSSTNGKTNNIAIAIDTIIETAIAGAGNDALTGSAADNRFKGNAGDDTIDGGAGTDTAIFAGPRSTYTLTDLGNNSVRVAGPDGSDTLVSVERLTFDDGSVDWPLAGGDHANGLDDEAKAFGAVPVGETVGSTLDAVADRDWFVVQLLAGIAYTIDLSGLQNAAATLANPHLRLRDGTGAIIAENDDIAAGTNLDSRITYVPTESGTYYIEAGAFADSLTGAFALTIDSPGAGIDDLADTLGDATRPFGALAAGGTATGAVEAPADRDWFAVQLLVGTSYSLGLKGVQGGGGTLEDPYLRLRDGAGVLIDENDDSADGTSPDSELAFTPWVTGTYYLEVGSYQDSSAGTYTVGVSLMQGADDFAGGPGAGIHPVGLLSAGSPSAGTIEDWGDRDWFAFQGTAGKKYQIIAIGAEASAGVLPEPYVILHDGAGRKLTESGDDASSGGVEAAISFIAIVSGAYFVEMASFLDLLTGTYSLRLAEDSLVDDAITTLYAAYCDRAPEADGAAYWLDRLEAGMTLVEIARSFSVQPECRALYGFLADPAVGEATAAAGFLDAVYANLFGRVADSGGKAYWLEQLRSGASDAETVLVDILSGAQTADALVIANKMAVGNYYLAQTFNHQVPMTLASARDALDDVDFTNASALAAQAQVDAFIAAVEEGRLFPETVPAIGVTTAFEGAP